MDAELKRKWVEALRSGEYAQGSGVLMDARGRYCCLGVLCVVAEAVFEPEEDTCLPLKGWDDDLIEKESELAQMNDNGMPFAEIADYIEANL